MWIANIGKKSAAFINHKPFHPGNYQNQEKVWLAEQKQLEEQKREKELEERRREEAKIEELRRALRGETRAAQQLQKVEDAPSPAEELRQKAREAARLQALQRRRQEAARRLKLPTKSTLYEEDVFILGHTTVFGSLYSRKEEKWGYKCCGCLDRSARCSATPSDFEQKARKRKKENTTAQSTGKSDSLPPEEEAETNKDDRQANFSGNTDQSTRISNDVSNTFRAGCNKRRAREGGVSAYLKLLELPEEGD